MMLIGSRNATRADCQHMIASIRAGKIPVGQLVTHRTTLRDSPRDIALWAHQKSGLIKAMIDVRGSRSRPLSSKTEVVGQTRICSGRPRRDHRPVARGGRVSR
jgi:hypothetical protein